MSSLLARTGRHRQRYENNVRLVSGCIPYRLTKDLEDHTCDIENRVEVLMISSPNRSDLVFPKGGWENDETVLEAACREALEEAGVKGNIREIPLGVWEFRSKSSSLEGGCKGFMFALEVTEELETWPEQENHDRKWLSIEDAFKFSRYEWMREALEEFLIVMAKEKKLETKEAIIGPSTTRTSTPQAAQVSADRPVLSPSFHVKPSSGQHHGLSGIIPLSWQVPLERLPLT